jgi:hypothetical protein
VLCIIDARQVSLPSFIPTGQYYSATGGLHSFSIMSTTLAGRSGLLRRRDGLEGTLICTAWRQLAGTGCAPAADAPHWAGPRTPARTPSRGRRIQGGGGKRSRCAVPGKGSAAKLPQGDSAGECVSGSTQLRRSRPSAGWTIQAGQFAVPTITRAASDAARDLSADSVCACECANQSRRAAAFGSKHLGAWAIRG